MNTGIGSAGKIQEWINASHREEKKFMEMIRSEKKYRIKTIYSLAKYIFNLFFFSFVLAAPSIIFWTWLVSNDFSVYACLVQVKELVVKTEQVSTQDCSAIRILWFTVGGCLFLLRGLFSPWKSPAKKALEKHMNIWDATHAMTTKTTQ